MISREQWKDVQGFLAALGDPEGITAGAGLREELDRFLRILLAKNEVLNLTAIREPHIALWKHLADSLALCQWEPLGTVVDWGSGGGLPGIPLALARRAAGISSPVFFLDSVGKKVRAVEEFAQELGLSSCRFFTGRGEALVGSPAFSTVDTVVMRAVAPADRAVAWMNPKVGRWVFLLGPQQMEAWEAQFGALKKKGFSLGRVSRYELPSGHGSRVLLEIVRA